MVNGTVDHVLTALQTSVDGTAAWDIVYITAYADGARFTLNWRHTSVTDNKIWISFTPTYYSAATISEGFSTINELSVPSEDYGMIQAYRTVACSALATYTGPLLTNGGNIAAAYVPGGSVGSNYFTTNPTATQGSFQNWENLAKVPGSYNGEISQGTYVFWTPEDQEDLEFRKPSEALISDDPPPALIISGKYNPSQALLTDQSVIRLEVVTLYEGVTTSQLLALQNCVGSQHFIDLANLALANQPHAMANASHMQWLKDFWGGVKKGIGYWEAPVKYLWNNREKVLPALESVGAML